VLAGNHAIEDLDTAGRTDATGRALPARFDGAELHGIAGHLGHIDRVVEDHDSAVADERLDAGEGLVVERRVELRFRQISAERPADLNSSYGTARRAAAAVVVEDLAQRDAEGPFDEPTALDVAAELDGQGTARAADAVVLIERRALLQDDRHTGQRDHIVDDG